ncbi:ankyrin repeat domain-containing protein [Paenibacillus sp. N4]|uniref:M48 family metallopeptidase n=1 Tax=Paenibacillus vietnamensis TaxID=2590547 RepID=UPI001CD0ED73|nr:M48 family metallopeptidase [Paenibacillus vietnamensis]MCA0753788.1 ankyrin repeat domain-containing protein [Paenibacillus vietnamensis]
MALHSYELNSLLIHKKEERYYVLALIFSIIIYLGLLVSILFIFLIPPLLLLPLFAQAVMMAGIRTNGVRVTPKQFPEVYAIVEEQCARMGFATIPDVYVMESSGVLNAFASRFFGRSMVVLYSDLFELIQSGGTRELAFVISHELAHIKRNHIVKQLAIIPALWIPFLGEAYSRACEYTCDRMAAYYTNDAEAAMQGLTVLAVGKTLYKRVDREEYLLYSSRERGLFVWLSEKLSTHPTLPKRISAVQQFAGLPASAEFNSSSRMVVAIAAITGAAVLAAAAAGITFAKPIVRFVETITAAAPAEDLLAAASEGDAAQVSLLLDRGANPDVTDEEGWTALMWAAQLNDTETALLLLEAGADPDIAEQSYEETALMVAIYNGSVEMTALLLEQGANPELQDSTGWTPLMSAASGGDIEALQLLLDAGANPDTADDSGRTAADYALENGYREAAEVLLGRGDAV